MKKTKLLQENRARAYRLSDQSLGNLQGAIEQLAPCACPRYPNGRLDHAKACPTGIVRRLAFDFENEAHRAGQCREREKIHANLRSRSGPTGFGLGYGAAAELVARMRWPR